jgi:hypothetical protein
VRIECVGHLASILLRMRSASVIAFATAASNAGDDLPSQSASFRAAMMLAAINRTRFRPSSTVRLASMRGSPLARHEPRPILGVNQVHFSTPPRHCFAEDIACMLPTVRAFGERTVDC